MEHASSRALRLPEDHAAYRAPEQLRGEGPDMLQSDVFRLRRWYMKSPAEERARFQGA